MPLPSPRKKAPTQIAIPPRLSYCFSQDSDTSDSPCTPSPHTPSPYAVPFSAGFPQNVPGDMHVEDLAISPAVGAKRHREEDDKKEPAWTEEEIETVKSTILHPFRPLSTSYPPGDLPPPNIIDELTNQLLAYAFRTSPTKKNLHSSLSVDEAESWEMRTEGWTHSWDATRKKVFSIALAASKGEDTGRKGRKESGVAGPSRPGLKRMDSMDFLDEGQDQAPPTIGRALRLSTTLQNTAKQEAKSTGMSRSSSENSLQSDHSTSTQPTTPVLNPASITVTPASPQADLPLVPRPQLLSRKSSYRNQPKRPSSLLQRGKSFTASDLAAEQENKESRMDAEDDNENQITDTIVEESPSALSSRRESLAQSPQELAKPSIPLTSSALGMLIPEADSVESIRIPSTLHSPLLKPAMQKPKLTRAVSTSAMIQPPHSERDRFLATQPSSNDRSVLAIPLDLKASPNVNNSGVENAGSAGWSDSDDEAPSKPRAVKKIRGGKVAALKVVPPIKTGGLRNDLSGGGLRSPFEERAQLDI